MIASFSGEFGVIDAGFSGEFLAVNAGFYAEFTHRYGGIAEVRWAFLLMSRCEDDISRHFC